MDLGRLYDQLDRLFASQDFAEDELDYAILDRHLRVLEQLDAMTTGALSVFDLFRREHAYTGSRFATTFGWDMARYAEEGPLYGDARLHPDDRHQLMLAGVQFTAEFKLLAWEQKQQGKRMREILRENGIDPDMLGRKRIENLSMRVNDLGRAGGDFSDQRVYNGRPAANERRKDMSLEDRVLWLTNELAYTKQEVEFLKKLQMANTEARKEWGSKHRHG